MYHRLRTTSAGAALFLSVIFLGACADDSSPTSIDPPPDAMRVQETARGINGDLITSDPATFAAAVREIGNENELLIVLKDDDDPRVSGRYLEERGLSARLVIGLPATPGAARRRVAPGLSQGTGAAHAEVIDLLARFGIEPYRSHPDFPVLAARLPDGVLVGVLNVLLHNPYVDYIEPNQRRPVYLDGTTDAESTAPAGFAPPLGSNPLDEKHIFHQVADSDPNSPDAWDHTRGSGAIIGILDTGFAGTSSLQWHEDGALLSSSRGIEKRGFTDDYDHIDGDCDVTGQQPYGDCVLRDDHLNGHGTAMVGLAGANDNSLGFVGIAPQALTVSQKMTANCNIVPVSECPDGITDWIEDDDFYWAIKWAENNGVEVLSMSFSFDFGATVFDELSTAYNTYDILLLSSTGNSAQQPREPQSFSVVMGVGGLSSSGASVGNEEHEEISARSSGETMDANCSGFDFCTPAGYRSSGGTSASTAIASGIAGLVRANEPSLSASQVRNRLIATSEGPHHRLNAWRAVTNTPPLSVTVVGPPFVAPNTTYTWSSGETGGIAPYSYRWYRNGNLVGTSDDYSGSSGTSNFTLEVEVTDVNGDVAADSHSVVVDDGGGCPDQEIIC